MIRQNARQLTVLEMYVCQIQVYFFWNDQLRFWSNESQLAISCVLNRPIFRDGESIQGTNPITDPITGTIGSSI